MRVPVLVYTRILTLAIASTLAVAGEGILCQVINSSLAVDEGLCQDASCIDISFCQDINSSYIELYNYR